MPVLHLGVTDVPYSQNRAARAKRTNSTVTTGDVAGWLEDEYHPMGIFSNIHGQEIGDELAGALAGTLENLMMGGPISQNPFGEGTSEIEHLFKKMLTDKELERLGYPGIPTQAALDGVSHRFKHPYKKRPRRPSFIDTGLYQSAFKAWVE